MSLTFIMNVSTDIVKNPKLSSYEKILGLEDAFNMHEMRWMHERQKLIEFGYKIEHKERPLTVAQQAELNLMKFAAIGYESKPWFRKQSDGKYIDLDSNELVVNLGGRCGWSLLGACATIGDTIVADFLLDEQGADIDLVNDAGETPLHIALESKQFDMARYLLKRNANPNKLNEDYLTPLMLAIHLDQQDMIRELAAIPGALNFVAPLSEGKWTRPRTALEYAVRAGKVEIVQYLLGQGAKQTVLIDNETLIEMVDIMLDRLKGERNDYYSGVYFIDDKKNYSVDGMTAISRLLKSHLTLTMRPSVSGMYKSAPVSPVHAPTFGEEKMNNVI
ncbi:MAG: ankyrin repeat domain-containing protein [Gammaproteobacteria bacterium]|nr:ankyrin repeat domain-containing protein [Gammaproteobacteria bacterium]